MNRLFSLRNPVGVIGAVAVFVFSLSACGDDSGNSSYNANDFSLQVNLWANSLIVAKIVQAISLRSLEKGKRTFAITDAGNLTTIFWIR